MEIRKSPNDHKKYRVVKLENGLVALLVQDQRLERRKKKTSDIKSIHALSESTDDSADLRTSEEATSEDEGDGTDMEGVADSGSDISGSGREEEEMVDGEKCKMKSKKAEHSDLDPNDLSSACGLCINVGSFSDPIDVPGLAHLLEHMVFMGSDKYPGDNALDLLTNRHGGFDNASTDYEKTVFTFAIHNKHLKKALDIFAHFFVSPQLLEDCLSREIKAVDSEFQISLQKDSARLQQLLCTLAKEDHPYSKFVWGNAISLGQNSKGESDGRNKDTNLCKRLREFQQRMYSSHSMTLTVYSADSLDTLEQWVNESFSAIPRNDLSAPDFSMTFPPFEEVTFNKLIKVVPVKDTQEIHMHWLLPPLFSKYRTKPLHYLGWLLGHEGKGSVLSYLKKRNLAVSIETGNGGLGYEFNSCFSLFTCSITLTDKGFHNIDQCVQVVFQYLKMLKELGPQERIFREIQVIEENEFNYQEDEEPEVFVERICEAMQLYPQEDYLTGDDLLMDYDPECIAMVTNLLSPDGVNIMWLSKSFLSECSIQEKWFGIKYSIQDFPKEWIQEDPGLNPELYLPFENEYISTDFSIIKVPSPTDYPVLIEQSDHHKLWYKGDITFQIPKAWICLMFETSLHTMESTENSVLMDMFESLYSHCVSELAYAAEMALLEYSVDITHRGMTIVLNGFSDKLHMLFKNLVDHFASLNITDMEEDFLMIKEKLKRGYHNYLLKPKKLCKLSRLKILEHQCFNNTLNKVDVIDHVTLSAVNDFMKRFKQSMFVEMLVQGNLSQEAAKNLMSYVTECLHLPLLSPSVFTPPRTVQLPPNTAVSYCTKNRDSSCPNTVLTDYYQCCALANRDKAMSELIVNCMHEPCFDTLRTKQQLGYEVYCQEHNTHGVVGISLTLITQTEKHSVAFASSRMDDFIKGFCDRLKSMKESDFKAQVNALVQGKLEPDFSLEKEVSRNWSEIVLRQYQFDRYLQEVEFLKAMTQEEACDWLSQYTHFGDNYRKLSIKVISNNTSIAGADMPDAPGEGRLMESQASCNVVDLSHGKLEDFKESLFIFPPL